MNENNFQTSESGQGPAPETELNRRGFRKKVNRGWFALAAFALLLAIFVVFMSVENGAMDKIAANSIVEYNKTHAADTVHHERKYIEYLVEYVSFDKVRVSAYYVENGSRSRDLFEMTRSGLSWKIVYSEYASNG